MNSFASFFPRFLAGGALAVAVAAGGAPAPAAAAPARSAEQWGIFEVELKGPAEGNPFTDVNLSAVFANGGKSVEVAGFYDGDGIYRVRFMPDRAGAWNYETRSNRAALAGQTGSFTATAPTAGNHGPVRVAHTYHFAYADGTPFRQIGTTCYNWTDATEEWQEQTLKTLAASPFNKVRMLLFSQKTGYRETMPPPRFPFVGIPPNQWDFTRFNPEYFRHFELRVGQLRDLGIEADVILFHPYGNKWGFNAMDAAGDDRYLRYLVARLAAYRNVWWSMANEYDFLHTKTEADWDRFFQVVQQSDPYGHLRSIHNGALIYNHNHPWVTHVSIQNGFAVEDPGRAEMYRDVYRKPVVYDEVKYEGDSEYRWGNLTGQEMVHRFWTGTVAGTYVGHGDYFTHPDDRWVSYGGVLRGQSAPRLAFLRRILEDSPPEGLNPVDKWQEPAGLGGKPGAYYLLYFGREAPTSWPFRLYRTGLGDGMQFTVEVIDTWNMTITPVDGVFTLKRLDRYAFGDATGRAVPLPGRPYLALRIRRFGTAGEPAREMPPTD
jgi:hypothetical protein